MFDIGFGELALIFVIGLVVLGPERLPVAVRTVVGWIRALRSLASTVQNELSQELKLQELQDSLKKVEEASKDNLSPELKASMEELREAADSMKKTFQSKLVPNEANQPHTIHNPLKADPAAANGSTPAGSAGQADAPAMAPQHAAGGITPDEMARRAEDHTAAPQGADATAQAGPQHNDQPAAAWQGINDNAAAQALSHQDDEPAAAPQGIGANVTPDNVARPAARGEPGIEMEKSVTPEPGQHQAPPIPKLDNDR